MRLFGHPTRQGDLEVWSDHLGIGSQKLEWSLARGVAARGDRVVLTMVGDKQDKKDKLLSFAPSVDGVADPSLAKVVAEIIIDSSGGSAPRATLLRQLTDTSAEIKRRFRDEDEQIVPLLVLLATAVVLVPLFVTLPNFVESAFRGGISLQPDMFVLFPRVSSFDPRVVVAAFTGAACAAGFGMRIAAGKGLRLWARGTIAGWRTAPQALFGIPRRISATLIERPDLMGVVFIVAFVLLFPAGRERRVVDDAGVHLRAAVPFFDKDIPWSDVTSVVLRPRGESYAVVLTSKDGIIVDSRDSLFYGLSEYELAQFAQRHDVEPR